MPQKEKNPDEAFHTTVLLHEAVNGLQIKSDGIYVDCTFGGGGHSVEILKKLGTNGKLFAFDQDEDAQKNLPTQDARLIFVPQNFKYLQRFLRLHNVTGVDGILADLGVSSYQLNEAARGFSIRFDGPLDMRMGKNITQTAADILATKDEAALQQMFSKYGEVTNARTLANAIVKQRATRKLETIADLKVAIKDMVKGNPNKYLAQVFQAIRIEVNEELQALEEMLDQSGEILNVGGRLSVITFHSLEDRIVKNFMKTGSTKEIEADEIYGNRKQSVFKLITKKPELPSAQEIKNNPRSRSAKLRIAEKI